MDSRATRSRAAHGPHSGSGSGGIVGGGSGAGCGSGSGGGSGSGSVGGVDGGKVGPVIVRSCSKPVTVRGVEVARRNSSGATMSVEPITVEEVKRRLDAGEPIVFLDSRNEESWCRAEWQIPQARRVPADDVESRLDEVPPGGLVVPYGGTPEDAATVASALVQYGWTDVRPLIGGSEAWRRAGYPTEPKPARRLTLFEVSMNLLNAEGD